MNKTKITKQEFVQTSIFDAMNNLKRLSQSQKKRIEFLHSKEVHILHNSDSETEEAILDMKRNTVKRKLEFTSIENENISQCKQISKFSRI